ncbi:MAG: adenylyl-sulfate kinase [Candidatus Obscuribacterales bacterium]|nr:adenylyl-sulfate kinase [Candidatus Obscuribacterales bacterium]
MTNEQRKIVIVGHVDHGKSTLLGRLLMDFGKVPQQTIEKVRKVCESRGVQLEPAFFLDAFQEEQEQGISIDTTRVNFEFEGHRFLLIDAPGHLEFLKNMTSGASGAETGILVIDGHEGIGSQTLRHLKILGILGVGRVVVVVNKMDKSGYKQARFEEVATEIRAHVEREGQTCLAVVPISALKGENLTASCEGLSWYAGLPLLPQLVASTTAVAVDDVEAANREPLRMVLQDVYRFTDERFYAGRIISGSIAPGARVFFSPSGKVSTVEALETFPPRDLQLAVKGDSVALRLKDQIFVERGEIVSLPEQTPEVNNELQAKLIWLNSEPLDWAQEYLLKVGTQEVSCRLEPSNMVFQQIGNGDFVDVIIKAQKPICFDRSNSRNFGVDKFVICTTFETVACGSIMALTTATPQGAQKSKNIVVESGFVKREEHENRHGHKGTVLWMTGLSGAGKSTLAKALERRLFAAGFRVQVLDGDNLRSGICADLGFEPEDRAENIRRVAHLSKLLLNTGTIVISACISPYEKDRRIAKEIIGAEDFHELFIFCPIEVCQSRDPKGLYKKATGGQISDFSGLNAPYQPPSNPKLRLDSSTMSIEAEVDSIIAMLQTEGIKPPVTAVGARGELAWKP